MALLRRGESMNPVRLESFITAYVTGLRDAIIATPRHYTLKPDDTPDSYALRVALTVSELMETSGPGAVDLSGTGSRNACRALNIDHSDKSICNYLEVAYEE